MTRLITIPLMILIAIIFYVIFEVQIAQTVAWVTGDGLLNMYALSRLEYHKETERVLELTKDDDAKTRLFALQTAVFLGDVSPIPRLITDPDFEVRMRAINLARQKKHQESGVVIASRILDYDPFGADKRAAQFERAALMEALAPTASRLNAATLASIAIDGKQSPKIMTTARKALFSLGPIAEGEDCYKALLDKPRSYRASYDDLKHALAGAAVVRYDGAVETIIKYARSGPGGVQPAAVMALGTLGGPVAKRMLQEYAKDPAKKEFETKTTIQKRKAAKLALLQLEAREKGRPVPTSLEQANKASETEDLLSSYGSSGDGKPKPPPPPPPATKAAPPPPPPPPPPAPEPEIEEEDDILAGYGTGN